MDFALNFPKTYRFLLQNKPQLVEPIDFENFILKNKTLLQNDPQRELLLYPPDDISVSAFVCLRLSTAEPIVIPYECTFQVPRTLAAFLAFISLT